MRDKNIKPFVKWAGGKRQLLKEIRKYLPKNIETYYEPFLGGGAVFFDLQPRQYVINDINSEMINVYIVIKSEVESLIIALKEYKNESEYYYKARELDRLPNFINLEPVKKAARIIYLNKTCFNGLFRVNSKGFFNVPFGSYKNPDIVNEDTLRAVNRYFNEVDGKILNGDFAKAVETADCNSFVYFDPPYDPLSVSSSFTSYTLGGFNRNEQSRLKNICDELNNKNCKFLLSNSSTEFIHNLYNGYHIEIVQATRAINSEGSSRGHVDEVLIRNY